MSCFRADKLTLLLLLYLFFQKRKNKRIKINIDNLSVILSRLIGPEARTRTI
jgi:hypothetical protein